jgi:hypothetical protein
MNYGNPLFRVPVPVKRKVFISSFHDGNQNEVDNFIHRWSVQEPVFIPKAIGAFHNDDFIDSNNPDYVMSEIRRKYIDDASVTIVLIGKCTHSRRYVDWEIKSSIRQGQDLVPNGLLAYILPSAIPVFVPGLNWDQQAWPTIPERLGANYNYYQPANFYGHYYVPPDSAQRLREHIEDAFRDRTNRSHLIKNASAMMDIDAVCKVCHVRH